MAADGHLGYTVATGHIFATGLPHCRTLTFASARHSCLIRCEVFYCRMRIISNDVWQRSLHPSFVFMWWYQSLWRLQWWTFMRRYVLTEKHSSCYSCICDVLELAGRSWEGLPLFIAIRSIKGSLAHSQKINTCTANTYIPTISTWLSFN